MRNQGDGSSRRDLFKGVVGASTVISAQAQTPAVGRPNIIYIHSHDTGRYIQPYGYNIRTPNLQKLANEGVLFRQAFDVAPTCSPSRAALLTGHCPHNNGMLGLAHRGFSLNDYKQHIANYLRPHGYKSTLVGVQHIAKSAATIGYDEVAKTRSNHVADVAPAAASVIKEKPKQPFFLDIGFQETHREFATPTAQEDERFIEPPATVPDRPATRQDMAAFHRTARILDDGVGIVLNALAEAGLAENTLVISTTDHGIAFPGMKCNLTVHGTSVYLIVRGPGGFSGGKVCNAMVSHMDLYPTICDLLDIEKPEWLQGKSLLPVVKGQAEELHDEIFAEVNYHAAYEPKRSVRTQRFNYVRHFGDRTQPVLPNCDDGPSKTVWLNNGWKDQMVPKELLFDAIFDPNEMRNLAENPAYSSQLTEMRNRLDAWMKRTNDPLLQGPVQAPAGAVVNDPNGISPKEAVRTA